MAEFMVKKGAYLSDEKYAKNWKQRSAQVTFSRICRRCYHPYGDHRWGDAKCPDEGGL